MRVKFLSKSETTLSIPLVERSFCPPDLSSRIQGVSKTMPAMAASISVFIVGLLFGLVVCGAVAASDTAESTDPAPIERIEPSIWFPAPVYHHNTSSSTSKSLFGFRRALEASTADGDRQRFIVQFKRDLTTEDVLVARARLTAGAFASSVSEVYIELHEDVSLASTGVASHAVFATLSPNAVDWIAFTLADVVAYLEPDGWCGFPPISHAIVPEPDVIFVPVPDEPVFDANDSISTHSHDAGSRLLATSYSTLSWNLDRLDQCKSSRPMLSVPAFVENSGVLWFTQPTYRWMACTSILAFPLALVLMCTY